MCDLTCGEVTAAAERAANIISLCTGANTKRQQVQIQKDNRCKYKKTIGANTKRQQVQIQLKMNRN